MGGSCGWCRVKAAEPQGATHSTKEKAPVGRGNFSAPTTKHMVDFATNPQTEKAFSSWQARYAMHGHALYRTASADGVIIFLAGKWGMFRELKSLEAVAAFFAQIGGEV